MSNTFPPADISGVGTLVAELHQQLLAAGHQSLVLVRRAPPGAGVVAIGGPKLLFPWIAVWRYLGLARAAGRDPFDVVHVHESDGVLVAAAVRGLRAFGRAGGRPRLLATLQVSYVRERRAVRAVRAGVPSGRVVSRPVASEWLFKWLRAPLLAVLGRLTVWLADGVVAPSNATAGELRADYGARAVAVIPNGIATGGNAEPPARETPNHAGTVLFVGRLRTRKAAAVLVEAWSELARDFPAARLVLVGGGEQHDRLAAQVERLRLGACVRLAGAVPRAEIEAWLRAADVFCLPSLYEGFPLAILEAMNQGLPVVATTVAGVPEAVDDGRTGLLVQPEDAPALAAALGRLLRDRALRRTMGRAGRVALAERFAIARICSDYLELWNAGRSAPAGGAAGGGAAGCG